MIASQSVADRLSSIASARQAIASSDELGRVNKEVMPFLNIVCQMQLLVCAFKTADATMYGLHDLLNQLRNGEITSNDLSQRKLPATCAIIMFTACLAKHEARDAELILKKLDPEHQQANFSTDVAWQSKVTEAALQAAVFAHDMIYNVKFRQQFRNVRNATHNMLQLPECPAKKHVTKLTKLLQLNKTYQTASWKWSNPFAWRTRF